MILSCPEWLSEAVSKRAKTDEILESVYLPFAKYFLSLSALSSELFIHEGLIEVKELNCLGRKEGWSMIPEDREPERKP